MILKCPECSTRFLVHDQRLMPAGRRVKCSRCKTIWFQKAPEKLLEEDLDLPPVDAIPESVKPIPEGSNLPVISEVKNISLIYVTGTALIALFVFFLFSFILKGPLVSLWEPMDRLYASVGMSEEVLGEAIALEDFKIAEQTGRTGRTFVQMDLFLRNKTSDEQDVPKLLVELYGAAAAGRERIAEFLYEPEFDILKAGQSTRVKQVFEVNRPGIETARITFTDKDDPKDALEAIPHPFLDDVSLEAPDDVQSQFE